ncbi:MAG TPA: HAMP domain-containing sensor histidine kinase, partial [Anaerolineae bacterium]|nr:HAMP domain-containing sensor histidine kinase [Anaerolineae bacterium]
RSAACAPLATQEAVIGALWIGRTGDIDESDLKLLVGITEMAANALYRAGLMETLEQRVADRTRELSEANLRLQELDRAKDQFVSNVSHELRTPLANIKLYLSLLERGKPDKYGEYLQTLRREQGRLEKMIDDLLDLSRLDLGVTRIEPVPTQLDHLLRQLVADRVNLAIERGLTLDYEAASDLPLALVDPERLTEVVTNLVTNAINYTPSGGSVLVQVDVKSSDDPWVTFTVRDTGPGVSAKDLPHLFERFYRGEVGRRASAPGTGLGLAISKEIIDRLGGRITVESEPGYGAAFTVWLRPAAS